MSPLITVVTVVLNGEEFIEETMLSVIQQSYQNIEYIIIDGGSIDTTPEIIKKYKSEIAYYISESDDGIYDAMNKGVRKANGDWIVFMNAGDFFQGPEIINTVVKNIKNISDHVAIAYGGLSLISITGHPLLTIADREKVVLKKIRYKLPIPHQAQFIRLELMHKVGLFNTKYRIAGDYDMTVRLLSNYRCRQLDGLVTASMRVGGISADPANSLQVLKEDRQVQVDHNMPLKVTFILSVVRVYVRIFIWAVLGEQNGRKTLDVLNYIRGRRSYWAKTK